MQNQPWHIIKEIAADNSRLHKEAVILREINARNSEFFRGLRSALDCMITFGVKQVKEKSDADGPGLDWDTFSGVAQRLADRKLTGHAARDAIASLMEQATCEQWNDWYRRILVKDLDAGFSESTVNKMVKKSGVKEYAIPVFEVQLAHDSANHEDKVSGKRLIEVKLDGVRVITIVHPDGRVNQYSRNGKELTNFQVCMDQFGQIAGSLTEAMVFDGEIMSSSFQDLMTQVRRKRDVRADDAQLWLFDMLPLAEFEKGKSKLKQSERSQRLREFLDQDGFFLIFGNVQQVQQELVDLDTDTGKARFREINAHAIAGGYEGIMIKDPDAVYECKRTVSWLKLKPFIELSMTVKNVVEGEGKYAGMMGAVEFQCFEDRKLIEVSVGSGWSDKDRADIWAAFNAGGVIGEVGEVRADAITQNQSGGFSLRFPRFKVWRGFEPGEKI